MISDLIRYSGLFIMMVGVIILIVSFLGDITGNTGLILALFLIVIGFATFLLVNRFFEK